ncbi:MAG: arginase family protein [Candidatus Woesearchaeota archaeon]
MILHTIPYHEAIPEQVVKLVLQGFTESGRKPELREEKVVLDSSDEDLSIRAIGAVVHDIHGGMFLGGKTTLTAAILQNLPSSTGVIVFGAEPREELLGNKNVIHVGIRTLNEKTASALNGTTWFSMNEIMRESLQEVSDSVMSVAKEWKALYLSVDMNVVDPAFAPDVLNPSPGGLSARELIHFVQRLKRLKNLAFVDVVGVKHDAGLQTSSLAARLILELC